MGISHREGSIEELVLGTPAGESKNWNWHPDIPIHASPLFEFPLNLAAIIRWYVGAWLPITEYSVYLLLAIGVWFWLIPPLPEMETLAVGWVGAIWARNLFMMAAFATLLHVWLYTWKGQGDSTRFMRNAPTMKHRRFFLGDQLNDNVFYVLVSGVTVWTVYETAVWLAYANGLIPAITFSKNPVWFVLLFLLIPMWASFHFYCVHRLLHSKALYDRFHSVHHRNVTVGPWSGLSMHPVEHLLYLSSLFVMLVVPSHPIHMLFLAFWLTIATATSHSGYQELILGNYRTAIANFFHQLHHRYFNCNYGNIEMPFDRWFGSFNDGTSVETKRLLRR